jgi:hypothetical protein
MLIGSIPTPLDLEKVHTMTRHAMERVMMMPRNPTRNLLRL